MARASLIISLSDDGGLQVELPWSLTKEFRTIPLTAQGAYNTIHTILTARARSTTNLGSDGAPTQAQVEHWERHAIYRSSTCAFCRAEAKAMGLRLGTAKPRVPAEEKIKSDKKLLIKTVKTRKALELKSTKPGPTDLITARTMNLGDFFKKKSATK